MELLPKIISLWFPPKKAEKDGRMEENNVKWTSTFDTE